MNERDVVAYINDLLKSHTTVGDFFYLRGSLVRLSNQLERQAFRKESKKEDEESI